MLSFGFYEEYILFTRLLVLPISLDSMNLKILFALWKLHITFQVFYTYFFLFLGEHQAAIHTNTAASLKWSTLSTFLLSGLVGLLLGLKAHQC